MPKSITLGTVASQPGTIQYGQFDALSHPTGHTEIMPVILAQGIEDGPCLWLTAGIHGPEHTGPSVLYTLITPELVDRLRGTIVAIPALTPLRAFHKTRGFSALANAALVTITYCTFIGTPALNAQDGDPPTACVNSTAEGDGLDVSTAVSSISGLPVVEEGKLVGILSIEDIVRAMQKNDLSAPTRQYMTREVATVASYDSIVKSLAHIYRKRPGPAASPG